MELLNQTPFAIDRGIFFDRQGKEQLVMVLKATWEILDDGALRLKEEQPAVSPIDEFLGEPDSSSITQEAELGPVKPATDVFLTGSAKATQAGTRVMDIRLKIGHLGRTARVFGPRVWQRRLGMPKIQGPEPFDTVDLCWENTFGGTDLSAKNEKHHAWQPDNPVGTGFRSQKSQLDWVGSPLPAIEHPGNLLQKPGQVTQPMGFGPLGRHWEPRCQYAGTYDDDWMDNRMPYLPDDFDDRYHNAGPTGLVAEGFLQGGENVEVTGCTRGRILAFELPRLEAHGLAMIQDQAVTQKLEINTVTIDTDALELRLLWKGAFDVHQQVNDLKILEWSTEGEMP